MGGSAVPACLLPGVERGGLPTLFLWGFAKGPMDSLDLRFGPDIVPTQERKTKRHKYPKAACELAR
jgi:hypothetical protein